ncbi:c-type cytochrome [Candidatus Nitrotoga fabula]|uniref:Cytochrome c class I n=1 Tax=Candidatus Nitrotoga fabula TaxID=2182327 RepID=A0A916FAI4_9PROT|nr:c-type cytochrome [Candidatus Nitrotoga fabula]CAE6718800.1 Putative Cytochrome c class I [Candidatus Nitrotoga fabula]
MNPISTAILATAGLLISGSVPAVDMPMEGTARCGKCHAIDSSSMSPSFMEISEKYKGDKDAVKKIAASITSGGSFGWDYGEMPAKGMGASDAEIQSLAKFIAGLTK